MNKQWKINKNGIITRGIEWTDYTWNPVGGCFHRCRWTMPDGSTAICYAESVANGVARKVYNNGFDHHYWKPEKLDEPIKLKRPSKIFLDSMSDLMGHWVKEQQIRDVFDICDMASWHTFQLLTKNPKRLNEFLFYIPNNLWVGVSSPPDSMFGNELSQKQKEIILHKSLETLSKITSRITWMSIEPLSWDVSSIIEQYKDTLDWVVIGAATNGKQAHQPDRNNMERLLMVLNNQNVPVFFKGNLIWDNWREEFPND